MISIQDWKWLLFPLPILLVGGLTLILLNRERSHLEQGYQSQLKVQADAVAREISLKVQTVLDDLQLTLEQVPERDPIAYLKEKRENPLVRSVFLWDRQAGLIFPSTHEVSSREDRDFLIRYSSLFEQREFFHELERKPETSAQSNAFKYNRRTKLQPRSRGWKPWFWEDDFFLLGWYEPNSGHATWGLEIETMALFAQLIPSLDLKVNPGISITIMDNNGNVFHQVGDLEDVQEQKPVFSVSIGSVLPHWQVSIFSHEVHAPSTGLLITGYLLVTSLLVAAVLSVLYLSFQTKKSYREAQQKSHFVSNISHELKTPLTTLRLYAELLRDQRVKTESQRLKFLDVMVKETERLSRLIHNALDFSRLEQGRKIYSSTSIELNSWILEFIEKHRYRSEEAGIELQMTLPEANLSVELDRDALEQIMVNLLDNALKYGEHSCSIELTDQKPVVIWVCDRGPGIPAQFHEKVFHSFFRVDQKLTASKTGSGIGLSIARQLARDMGCDLTYCDREDRGACFRLEIGSSEGEYEAHTDC